MNLDPSLILLGEESDEIEVVTPDERDAVLPDEWGLIPWDEWSEVRMPGSADAEEQDDPRGFISDNEPPLYPPRRAARE